MSFAQTDDDKRRLWNSIGGLLLGEGAGAGDVDFHVTTRDGKVVIDSKPVTPVSPVIANVGGYGITLPMVLLAGAVAFLVFRK